MRTSRIRIARVPGTIVLIPLALALLAAAIVLAAAGEGHGVLQGRVFDQNTGDPIVQATVTVKGTALTATTDSTGAFVIAGVPCGIYTVEVVHNGMARVQQTYVVVEEGRTTNLTFTLRRARTANETIVLPKAKDEADAASRQELRTHSIIIGNLNNAWSSSVPSAGTAHSGVNFYSPNWNTEEYGRIVENEFRDVRQHPLSTFSIDVDAASYANVRRFINSGLLPPRDAVRIEEMINYFTYDYPGPVDGHPFSITAEMGACPWAPEHQLIHIGLQGRSIETEDLPPGNLVFLLDVSGSMDAPNKLPLLKTAFGLLVNELRPQDRVAIVVYAGAAGLVLESTPGSDKAAIRQAIEELHAGGNTAGAAGIRLAYETAQQHFMEAGNNRVILATDGDFNVGTSSTGELLRMIEEKRSQGVFLSVLGFGAGNLKDQRMEQLADKGNGNYNYIDNVREARRVLVSQMGGTLFTIAQDVKIQVEFNPAFVRAYRLVGYENRLLSKEDFNDDTKDAGELGAGHSVTALYEVVPVGVAFDAPDVDPLKYQTPGTESHAATTREALTVKFRYKDPGGTESRLIERTVPAYDRAGAPRLSDDFRFAAAVAEFGMLLTDSKFKSGASWDQVVQLARGSLGEDRGGYRHEFVSMVETCRDLAQTRAEQ